MLAAFRSRYDREPDLWVRAPGRVDLMGSHTDYNEGSVVTLPIDRDTWIAAAPRADDRVHVESLNLDGACEFATTDVLRKRSTSWGIYVQGVAHLLREAGFAIAGCDALVHGTVPVGSGLSSSASLESAIAVLFRELAGFRIEPLTMALLCQRAENEIVGMSCGILDQYSSILGEKGAALVLDCRHLRHEQAAFPADLRVVICNTCAPRQLTGSEYGERRAACEEGARTLGVSALRDVSVDEFARGEGDLPDVVARRCRFIVEENARVGALAAALSVGDRDAIDSLTRRSFEGARDLFEITVSEMEAMIDAMRRAPGVVGARQAGAGFGGCMVAFVEADAIDAFGAAVTTAYREATGIAAEVYSVEAADGAGVMSLPTW